MSIGCDLAEKILTETKKKNRKNYSESYQEHWQKTLERVVKNSNDLIISVNWDLLEI